MVESAQKSRADIQKELLAYAEEQIAKWDSMTLYHEDKEKDYIVKQDWVDGIPLTVVKWKAAGVE